MDFELLKPLILRAIGILLTALVAPALQKAQALGLFGDTEAAQIVATAGAVLLAVAYFVYRRVVSLAIQKVSLALPTQSLQIHGDLLVAQARVAEAVKAEPLPGKLDILRTGIAVGAGLAGRRGKTGKAFEIAEAVAEQLRRH